MSAAAKLPPVHLTVAEFLDWSAADRSGTKWQLVDGEPVAMAPASENHGMILAELSRLLANRLIERDSPCRVAVEPGIIPQVGAAENWRIPDLAVTCAPPRGSHEMLAPVVVAEILSPRNYLETRRNIWAYTTVPSVREILVLHSTRIEAELLRRGADGTWPARPLTIPADGSIELESLGVQLKLRALYRTASVPEP